MKVIDIDRYIDAYQYTWCSVQRSDSSAYFFTEEAFCPQIIDVTSDGTSMFDL